MKTHIFYGDIGGTKTLLQLAKIDDAGVDVVLTRKYSSQEYISFVDMVKDFLQHAEINPTISAACFAVAGPVIDHQKAKLTNLNWVIDSSEIAAQCSLPQVMILNDFEAAALGIDALSSHDLEVLQIGLAHPLGMRVILGAGTGMGVSWSAWVDGRRHPFSSEAGHIDFAATDDLQIDLWKALQKKFGHVSVERLLSGPGLTDIFKFLQDHQKADDPIVRDLPEDSGAVITRLALKQRHRVAIQALELFVTIYGAYAGNLALVGLCRGGVYIAGGIAPKILEIMKGGGFLRAFCDKGRFSQLMREIPVHVVINPEIGLLGARLAACDLLNSNK
ncbi:glucokinase [Nitrosomonas sp. PY1]|uniref:glucokinase n=1 Tax=Nitrosomonas sp. PY1 TaxID=1803906 RepID=UPI001FC8046E|nr:glucokinase [Nitrosomonas sp. PY1]